MKPSVHRVFTRLSVALFALFLCHGFAGVAIGPDRERIWLTEYRTVTDFPSLPLADLKELPKAQQAVEEAFADRVLFRTRQLFVLSHLYHALGVELFPERVIFGREDWYYLGNFFQEAMDKYRGLRVFGGDEVRARIDVIRKGNDLCRERGIPFLFVVAPDKQSALPEFLPAWANVVNPVRNVTRMEQQAEQEGIAFLDLTPALRDARRDGVPYYRGDSHWNKVGTYHAFKAIFAELVKRRPGYTWPEGATAVLMPDVEPPYADLLRLGLLSDISVPADDGMRLWFPSIPDTTLIVRITADGAKSEVPLASSAMVPGDPIVFVNAGAFNDATILLLRDSFGDSLHPFFAAFFSTVVEARYYATDEESFRKLVETHRPDFVVWEESERLL